MDILNDNGIPQPQKPQKRDTTWGGNLYLGVILILVGVVWLFYNFDMISYRFFDILFSWQMLVVVIGGYLIAVKRYSAGIIIGALGVLFVLMDAFDIHISVSKIVLPAVVIAIGISLLITFLNKK